MLGLETHIGQFASSPEELADLSLEKGRRNFFTEEEFKRGRSKSNISCTSKKMLATIWKYTTKHPLGISGFELPQAFI